MIDAKIFDNEVEVMLMGSTLDFVSDVAVLVKSIHAELFKKDPMAATLFRDGVIYTMTNKEHDLFKIDNVKEGE